jgi:hypothetical protein
MTGYLIHDLGGEAAVNFQITVIATLHQFWMIEAA